MIVLLDTNVVHQHPYFDSAEIEQLLEYIKHTENVLAVPEIVIRELVVNFREELQKLSSNGKTLMYKHGKMRTGIDYPVVLSKSAMGNLTEEYEDWLRIFLQEKKVLVTHYDGESVSDLVEYALKYSKPGSDESVDLKDLLVWLATKQASNGQEEVCIITNDKGFSKEVKNGSEKSRILHKELAEQCVGSCVELYTSIGQFLGSNARQITGMDLEWFTAQEVAGQLRTKISEAVSLKVLHADFDAVLDRNELYHRSIHGPQTEPEYLYAKELENGDIEITVWFRSQFSIGNNVIRVGQPGTYATPIMTAASIRSSVLLTKDKNEELIVGPIAIYDEEYDVC